MSQRNPISRAVLSRDTSFDVEQMQVELWRKMSPLRKARTVADLSRGVRELSLAGIRLRHPGASQRECLVRLAILTLGHSVACSVYPEASSLSER